MRNKFFLGALIATALCANAAKDPVLMTVNGKDVKLSEFEYLYQKNNKQQLEMESLEDYVDRFVVYKLKVADAEAAGLDTLESFKKEYEGYKKELMRPYLENNEHSKPYARETYERMKKNLEVSHIMLPLGFDENEKKANKAKIDSLRACLDKGEDFGSLAERFSSDAYSARDKGNLGNMWVERFPYAFEDAAYKTPVGGISPVVETSFGFHIIKVNGEHPTNGKYHVAHILKFYNRNDNDSAKSVLNAKMDSLYSLLKNGVDFAAMAKKESDDSRTSRNNGEIGWVGIDQLVKHLETEMLKLKVGEVSKPIVADYGVHIIKLLAHKPLGSYEEMEPELIALVNKDERAIAINEKKLNDLKKEYKFKSNSKASETISLMLDKNNGYDSAFVEAFQNSNITIFSYKGAEVKASQVADKLNQKRKMPKEQAVIYINETIEKLVKESLTECEKEDLVNKYPEYANLLNEYKEGMLLFEISNKKVWDKAGQDKAGLEKYFEDNKSKYTTWTAPRFKGVLIYSVNDSIENAVKDYAKTLGQDTLLTALHKKFRRDIRIEKHLSAKGDNAFVDELVFKSGKAEKDKKYVTCFVFEGKLIDQPEEAADVKGLVTTDYQNLLEKEWVEELKSKSKVSINKKVLKKVKE